MKFTPSCCLGLALLAGACDRRDPLATGNAGAGRVVAARASDVDLDGARQRIDAIYAPYTRGVTSPYFRHFTPELRVAVEGAGALGIDADPFCDCQVFGRLTYRVDSLAPDGDGAVARVAIANFDDRKTIVIRLVRRGDAWLVADVGEGEDSLARRLAR